MSKPNERDAGGKWEAIYISSVSPVFRHCRVLNSLDNKRSFVKLSIMGWLFLVSRVLPTIPVSARVLFSRSLQSTTRSYRKGGNLVQGGVARYRANDSRKIVPPVLSAILRIQRDVKRTMPEQGSSKRGGNDEVRRRSHLSLVVLKVRTCRQQLNFRIQQDSRNHVNKGVPSDSLQLNRS